MKEDCNQCNCQGGLQKFPVKGKCQIEGGNVVYVCNVTR